MPVGVALSTLIDPAMRIAGILNWVGNGSPQDNYDELIPELNRMIGNWNCARPNIFTIAISDIFPLSSQLKYSVGPGADFDMPRPQRIENGVIVFMNTTPYVRMPPMYQMNDDEWARVNLQLIPNGIPLTFYYDGGYDPTTGWANIYVWPQTTQQMGVEWYFWQALDKFTAKTDMVALPPGYEDAFVYNLAKRVCALNPRICVPWSAENERFARQSLAAIESINAPQPKQLFSDFPDASNCKHWDYRIGASR